jgi:Protein of unknown function (DUF3352)
MKRQSLIIAIIVGIISLLVVGTNAYGWVSVHRSIRLLDRNQPQPPASAIFVPKNAPVAISLIANLDELANLNSLATPTTKQSTARQAIKKWQQQLGDRLHLDYRQQIAPWLGEEITFAITDLDFDRLPRNGSQPGYLAILSSRNPEVSSQIIQAWWDRQIADNRLKIETYQGVKLADNRRDKIASAIVNDRYILVANHPKVLREAIDNLQPPRLSLLDNTDYQQVVAANSHHKVGIGYARLPDLKHWLGKEAGEKYPVAGINIGVDRQGLIADLSLYPTTPEPIIVDPTSIITQPKLVKTLKYLPRQSNIAIAGTDLAHWQQQLATILPEIKSLIPTFEREARHQGGRTITAIGKQLSINLTENIFSWTTGEYALAAIPNPTQTTTDWMFIAERTQPERADEAIGYFDQLASLAGYNIGLLPWQEKQVIGWTKLVTDTSSNTARLIADVAGVHTNISNKYTIFASSVAAMDATLKAVDQQSILDSDRYQRGANLLTATETGYLYGDWQTIQLLLPKQLQEQPLVKSVSDGILAGLPNISVSRYVEAGIQRITLLFQVE